MSASLKNRLNGGLEQREMAKRKNNRVLAGYVI
jgi:hypothetical protein